MGAGDLDRDGTVEIIATTTQTVAKEAGVADGTLYLYVQGKQDLLVTAFKHVLAEMMERLDSMSAEDMEEMLDRELAVGEGQTDFEGEDDRADTESVVLQPIYFVQLGKGLYLRGAPIAVFYLENDTYHVPVGLGFGKVIPTEKVVFNFFIEPQFTILSKGAGQPEFQLFMAVNLQFR